jgi:hypothetical protein
MEDLEVEKAPFTIEETQDFMFNIETRAVADSLNRSFHSDRESAAINDQLELEEEASKYETTSYRWVILFFFFNTTVYVSCCQTSLTPVAAPLAKAFGVPVISVTMTSIIFSIAYVPMTFVAIWMFKKLRPSTAFRIACVNLLFGSWIRSISLATDHFGMILLGYTIISLSYPILLSAVTLVCNNWLGDHERTFWTQICGLSIPIGTVISFIMTGLIYKDPNTMKDDTKHLIAI